MGVVPTNVSHDVSRKRPLLLIFDRQVRLKCRDHEARMHWHLWYA